MRRSVAWALTLVVAGTAACGSGGGEEGAAAGGDTAAVMTTAGADTAMAMPTGGDSAGMAATAPAPAGDGMAELDATITAAEGGLTNLAHAAAVSNIEGWQARLRAANNPALTSIADDLETLKGELQKGTVDGRAIGRLLTQVGAKTTAAGAGAQGAAGEKVSRLGTLLTTAGGQLSGS